MSQKKIYQHTYFDCIDDEIEECLLEYYILAPEDRAEETGYGQFCYFPNGRGNNDENLVDTISEILTKHDLTIPDSSGPYPEGPDNDGWFRFNVDLPDWACLPESVREEALNIRLAQSQNRLVELSVAAERSRSVYNDLDETFNESAKRYDDAAEEETDESRKNKLKEMSVLYRLAEVRWHELED